MSVYILWYKQVSAAKPVGERSVSSHHDSSVIGSSDKQPEEESAGKEKSSSRLAAAQDRIRAKLIAISEQSAADVKMSQPSQSRDSKTSSRVRSPSPKRHTHVRVQEHFELEWNYFCRISGLFYLL